MEIPVAVSGLGGHVCTVMAKAWWTVESLKDAIGELSGIPAVEQDLFIGGAELANDSLCSEVLRPAGGLGAARGDGASAAAEEAAQVTMLRSPPDVVWRARLERDLVSLQSADELKHLVGTMLRDMALEPRYGETFVEVLCELGGRFPEFPLQSEDERVPTFWRVLLNTCQQVFENLPSSLEPTREERASGIPLDELDGLLRRKRRTKTIAIVVFLGHLFNREKLAVKVIGQIVHDLIAIRGELPLEHQIESVCELLRVIGRKMDQNHHGKLLMHQFSARLSELLLRSRTPGGSEAALSRHIQQQIEEVLRLRRNDWRT